MPKSDPKSAFQRLLEIEHFVSNPFTWSKEQLARKQAEADAVRKKRVQEEQARRDAVAQFFQAERIAADPQRVIKLQEDAIQQLNRQIEEQKKTIGDLRGEQEKQSKGAGSQIEDLKKKIADLSARLDARKKELEEKETAAKKAGEDAKKELDESRERTRAALQRQRADIDALRERALSDFESATFDGIELVRIPAGSFVMGTNDEQIGELQAKGYWSALNAGETPAHKITITHPFWIGKFEVTQKQWKELMEGHNPASFKGDDLPIETVSRDELSEFFKRLGERSAGKYRLPTEAEWEYCCRAGSEGLFGLAAEGKPITFENLDQYAWMTANSGNKTNPIGKKFPNAWGLYDMHGNVWEWCRDWFSEDAYRTLADKDPFNDKDQTERVFRGGCWMLDPQHQRAAFRSGNLPSYKSQYVGFRVLREVRNGK